MRGLVVAAVLAGCAQERDSAPPQLDDLARSIFRDWADDEALSEHTLALSAWLAEEAQTDAAWDGLRLSDLDPADVDDVDLPTGTELRLHEGLANAAVSAFDIRAHAELLVEPDQTWTDPGSFLVYERDVIEGDPEAFAAGSGAVRTMNTVEKRTIGITIPYSLRKDYRWVPGPIPAVVGRTWITDRGCSDNGKNCVNQSFGIDVFVGEGQSTRRLYAVWLEVVSVADGLMGEDGKIAVMAKGNQAILEAADEELASR
jgi:hypothetical protein